MQNSTDMFDKAREFGFERKKYEEEKNDIERKRTQNEWDDFVATHHPRMQIVLREAYYDAYYGNGSHN